MHTSAVGYDSEVLATICMDTHKTERAVNEYLVATVRLLYGAARLEGYMSVFQLEQSWLLRMLLNQLEHCNPATLWRGNHILAATL